MAHEEDAPKGIPIIEVTASKTVTLYRACGAVALFRLVGMSPKPDTQGFPGVLAVAAEKNGTVISPLRIGYPEDRNLTIGVLGEGENAQQQVDQTIKDIDALVNPWRDPVSTAEVLYPRADSAE